MPAREVLPLLENFPALWKTFTPGEKGVIPQAIFAGLYFDHQEQLRRAMAHEPFDKLLNLPEDGILNP